MIFMFHTTHDQFLRSGSLLIDTQSGVLFSFENALKRIYSLALPDNYSSLFDWPDPFGS